MSQNLNQYLTDVFRNVVKDATNTDSQDQSIGIPLTLTDKNKHHFIVDKKFSLGLDEII
jgi:hypothetical protein